MDTAIIEGDTMPDTVLEKAPVEQRITRIIDDFLSVMGERSTYSQTEVMNVFLDIRNECRTTE